MPMAALINMDFELPYDAPHSSKLAGERSDVHWVATATKAVEANSRVFISHSRRDKKLVRRLAGYLEKHGILTWVDDAKLLPGDPFPDRIARAIAAARLVLVVLSTSSVESQWVLRELKLGMEKEAHEGRVVVVPLLIEDCEVPRVLKHKHYLDLRTTRLRDLAEALKRQMFGNHTAASR